MAAVKSSVESSGEGSEEVVRKGGVDDARLRRNESRGSLRASVEAMTRVWKGNRAGGRLACECGVACR